MQTLPFRTAAFHVFFLSPSKRFVFGPSPVVTMRFPRWVSTFLKTQQPKTLKALPFLPLWRSLSPSPIHLFSSSSSSSSLLSPNPLSLSPHPAGECRCRTIRLAGYSGRRPPEHQTAVTWWRNPSARRTRSAVGVTARFWTMHASVEPRLGGCLPRFSLAVDPVGICALFDRSGTPSLCN